MSELHDILEKATKEVFEDYKSRLSNRGYALANTISYEVVKNGTVYQCILNLTDYWKYLEYGRAAGKKAPPPEAILNWLDKKNLFKSTIRTKEGKNKIITEEQAAFLIGRAIAKNGIKPKYHLTQSLDILDKYKDDIQIALQNDINNGLF